METFSRAAFNNGSKLNPFGRTEKTADVRKWGGKPIKPSAIILSLPIGRGTFVSSICLLLHVPVHSQGLCRFPHEMEVHLQNTSHLLPAWWHEQDLSHGPTCAQGVYCLVERSGTFVSVASSLLELAQHFQSIEAEQSVCLKINLTTELSLWIRSFGEMILLFRSGAVNSPEYQRFCGIFLCSLVIYKRSMCMTGKAMNGCLWKQKKHAPAQLPSWRVGFWRQGIERRPLGSDLYCIKLTFNYYRTWDTRLNYIFSKKSI